MKKKLRIGVLASTRGTNLQALIDDLRQDDSLYEIVCVVSDVNESGAISKAREAKIPGVFLDPVGKKRTEYDEKMASVLMKYEVDLVCLIGYMRIITKPFIDAFRNRIINVHPALIPAYSGPGFYGDKVHESVLADGCKISGMTIHYVDENVDGGEIICQKACEIEEDDNVADVKAKVQALEKEWYPKVVRMLARGGQ